MIDILYSLFSAIYHGVVTILNLIVSIPKYVTAFVNVVTSLIPGEVLVILMVGVIAYVVIHVKRLVL